MGLQGVAQQLMGLNNDIFGQVKERRQSINVLLDDQEEE